MGKEARRITNILTKFAEKTVREMGLYIHGELMEQTPVDTGWAMNNWIASLGNPFTDTVGSPDNNNSSAAMSSLEEIFRFNLMSGRAIFLSNNVPYIEELNAGSSSQAPEGFVEKIVQKANTKFEGKSIKK